MSFTAADVKRLREETDAPMMECNAALKEANGDYDRAKEILREKGKAAAAKRSDRSTAAGLVALATKPGKVAGVVVECETDFVSGNADFQASVQAMADSALANLGAGATLDQALAITVNGHSLKDEVEALVGKIRENIVLKKVLVLEGAQYGYYLHHTKDKAAIVTFDGGNDGSEPVAKDLAMQVVSLTPAVLSKDNLSQEMLDKEMKIEIDRALQEGKPEEMAKKIAEGRVNKEFVKSVVLMEQPFFKDGSINVSQHVANNGGGMKVLAFDRLFVGQE